MGTPLLWAGFVLFVLAMLALDLGVFHRQAHVVGYREAVGWSAAWALMALLFGAGLWWTRGPTVALEFGTGWLLEKALSVDNLFVFVLVFGALQVPARSQHRVLFWGIVSALVLRAALIFAGGALLARFHWLSWVFGAFLVLTGVKVYRAWRAGKDGGPDLEGMLRWLRRLVPSTERLDGEHFFSRQGGRWLATPLFLALCLVEVTDVVFALDSIPAVYAVTGDPFIVFTSNVFAILGLRSLYFLLAGLLERFEVLKLGLSGVLVFVGLKMAAAAYVHVPPLASAVVVLAMLAGPLAVSWWRAPRARRVVEDRAPAGEPEA